MTGWMLPLYIPHDVDMISVKDQVAEDGVSAPPELVPPLLGIVDQARKQGVNLKIVVIDRSPLVDTALRDISTVVGANYHDVTVLTLSPGMVGSFSTHFPRVTLEVGEDHAKTGNPVVSAQHFVDELNAPEFPWASLTIALLVGVLAAAVGTRFLQLFSRRTAAAAETPVTTPDEPSSEV